MRLRMMVMMKMSSNTSQPSGISQVVLLVANYKQHGNYNSFVSYDVGWVPQAMNCERFLPLAAIY